MIKTSRKREKGNQLCWKLRDIREAAGKMEMKKKTQKELTKEFVKKKE